MRPFSFIALMIRLRSGPFEPSVNVSSTEGVPIGCSIQSSIVTSSFHAAADKNKLLQFTECPGRNNHTCWAPLRWRSRSRGSAFHQHYQYIYIFGAFVFSSKHDPATGSSSAMIQRWLGMIKLCLCGQVSFSMKLRRLQVLPWFGRTCQCQWWDNQSTVLAVLQLTIDDHRGRTCVRWHIFQMVWHGAGYCGPRSPVKLLSYNC